MFAIPAAVFMFCEVLMDLLQPEIMSRIVDEGVSGAGPDGVGCLAFCLSKANPLFSRLQAQLDRINSIMQEDVSGIRIIKACVRELYEKVRFGKANDDLIKTQLRVLTMFPLLSFHFAFTLVSFSSSKVASALI